MFTISAVDHTGAFLPFPLLHCLYMRFTFGYIVCIIRKPLSYGSDIYRCFIWFLPQQCSTLGFFGNIQIQFDLVCLCVCVYVLFSILICRIVHVSFFHFFSHLVYNCAYWWCEVFVLFSISFTCDPFVIFSIFSPILIRIGVYQMFSFCLFCILWGSGIDSQWIMCRK